MSKLKTRIDDDIKMGILPPDEWIYERYKYHLRQLWEEDSAAQGFIQLRHSGKSREGEAETPSFCHPKTLNADHLPSSGAENARLPLQTANPVDSVLPRSQFLGSLQEEGQSLGSGRSSKPSEANSRVSLVDLVPTPLELPISEPTAPSNNPLLEDSNIDCHESFFNQGWDNDFNVDDADFSRISTLTQVDADSTASKTCPRSEPYTFDYYVPDDPLNILSNNTLQMEGQILEAFGSWNWNHVNTGNEAVFRPVL